MNYSRLLILPVFIFLISCGGTRTVSLKMLEPGAIVLRPEIKTVALLNRAIAMDKKSNKIEAVITGESIQQDKQGRQQVLQGLNNALNQYQSPRFRAKLLNMELVGNGSGTIFPPHLGWDTVNQICREQGVDAVVSLETYDSDCMITHETGSVEVKNQFGLPIPTIHFTATQKVTIKLGFRIYDPVKRTIADQYTYSYWRTWTTNANSLGEALESLVHRQLAINQTAAEAGADYETRISPTWKWEYRNIYRHNGNKGLAVGSRMALIGNWQEAETYWQNYLATSPSRKKAGKACYNMAVSRELAGDLTGAREWITKAYGIYNLRNAEYYQNIINRRYNETMRLNQQMGTGQ